MQIVLNKNPSKEDISDIQERLQDYNRPYFEGVRDDDIACHVNGVDGRKVAGIVGRIRGKWLLVEYLWVAASKRGQGLGSELLSELESYAKKQGCHSSMLNTTSFQAKPFYKKQGYETQMVLNDLAEDLEIVYMTKRL